ncbi:MAG: altronate dehydratase family protein [Pseudomonadota bacterium]
MSQSQNSTIRLSSSDNVVVARTSLSAGDAVEDVAALTDIPSGHKVASRAIAKGEAVRKYAQIIGYAASDIAPGDHLHTHNIEFRNTEHDYEFSSNIVAPMELNGHAPSTFEGFRRNNGKVGTRNYIGVLTSVNCSATAARMIAEHFTQERLAHYPNVDGVAAFVHGTGCGMADTGEGYANLQRVLWGFARHPNFAGVVLVGLGCEVNQIDFLLEAYGLEHGPLFQTMNIQTTGGLRKTVESGVSIVNSMLPHANEAVRETCPVSELTLALQCGGSDGWSGITANPALGHAADRLVAEGGTVVLAETPEIYGAEHLLTRRAVDEKVGQKLVDRILWWEDYTARNFGSMDNNPSPGNKRGGLTTILEKSLGAVAKAGTSPLNGVYLYGEPIDRKGFVFMDSPGYDPASVTGQVASGSNLVCFTTGRGSAFGCKPSPSLKIATNTSLYQAMPEDMDINAGRIVSEGATLENVGAEIFDRLLDTASGRQTLSEAQGLGDYEFVPWQIGATM